MREFSGQEYLYTYGQPLGVYLEAEGDLSRDEHSSH